MPEARMLLMAGLMLADKTAGLEEELRVSEEKVAALTQEITNMKTAPPDTVEVAIIPQAITDSLAEFAARAESLANKLDTEQVG